MQLDMFGATEISATLDAAPPIVSADGAWTSPESIAFNAALKRGSLGDAVAILNRLKTDVVMRVLLASGFSLRATKKREDMIASVQGDVVAAARQRMTGMELHASRENFAIDGVVPQPGESTRSRQRISSELAGKMSRGIRVIDGAGKEYEAFSATHDYLEVHPLGPDGKPQVFAGNSIRFDLNEHTGKTLPSNLYPPRRHEPIYLVEPFEVALLAGNEHTALTNVDITDELTRQDDDRRIDQSEEIPARSSGQDRGDGSNGDLDREPVDDGLAGSREGADAGELLSGLSGDASQAREGNPGERSESAASGAARDFGTVRDQGIAASTGGMAEGISDSQAAAIEVDDYVMTDADRIGLGGLAEKFHDNLQAIRIVRALEAEKRNATPDERRSLARYVGWGGLKGVLDPQNKQWARQHVALRALLNDAEWAAASRSQLDAFYTAPVVAKSIYSAVSRLGFNQGRIIDPSIGVGNFFGTMPIPMRNGSSLHGVELDVLSSQVVTAIYPRAKIAKATGFQDYKVPAGYFDLVIGNPPFGSQPIVDDSGSAYSGWSIHNYFFAKSIELLRPGGMMSMVVTHNFLDKLDPHVRQWIARRAELVSGLRLPNTAFKENANTEVVTDILIFRRLDKENMLGKDELPDWLDTTDVNIENPKTGETGTVPINNYFLNHPENVLGENSVTGNMYRANEYTVLPNGDLETQLEQWVASLPAGLYVPLERPAEELVTAAAVSVPEFIKEGSYYLQDGGIWVRLADQMGEQRAEKWEAPNQRAFERMAGMIEIRDTLRAQMRLERSAESTEAMVEEGRAKINTLYDTFQKKYGFLNDPTNRRLFLDDTESALLQALEFDYEKAITPGKAEEYGIDPRPARAVKADILSRRVLFPPMEMEIVETAKDALLHSLNMYGRVEMDYMERAYGKDEKTILAELGDLLFVDPVDGLVTADQYLSGDVKTKLVEAKRTAERDVSFSRNVDALTGVIPTDKLPSEIHAAIGASWIPANIFAEFAKEISGADASYHYVRTTAQWLPNEKGGADYAKNHSEYGTEKMGALGILAHLLNSRAPEVKKRVTIEGNERYVTDEEATEVVRQRADKIRTHWDSWLWSNGDRADLLTSLYNDRFNRTVERRYDGSHLTFPGMSPMITLLAHQKNGVWRGLQDRTMLLDKVVGSGKTFEIIAMMMEMRRLGITKKPMIGVPNHLTLQWRSDFYRLYPGANVLAATPQDFDKENRERFFSKIVTGNWDAVIVGHSSLKKLAVPLEAEMKIVEEQFNDITDAIEDLKRERGDRNVIRDMEKIKANLEAKLGRLKEKGGTKDKVVDFGDLGVDALAIDELHEFKNLFFTTQMQRVSGLGNPAGSGKAFDLFVKIRWLRETFGPSAPLITATGTPVSNSLAEMFTMQRYMQYEKLKADGLHVFDAWAKQYGDVQNVYEVAPSGTGYRLSQRFAKFKNLASLMGSYRSFADVITLDDLKAQEIAQGKTFPVPKLAGGRPKNVVAQRSELQEKFFGVPEIERNEAGEIQFEVDLSLPSQVVQRKDGKFVLEQMRDFPMLSHPTDTREETAYLAALASITPKMKIDPNSIVGQFENLRELTRRSGGKINALSLTGLANKAGLDYRLIDSNAPDFPDSKVNQAVREMLVTATEWEADKGVQLVFCDLSVPLSAKAKMASKEKRIYVRDDDGDITHKRGTLHTVKEYEGLPYYLVVVGKGNTKTFSMYDPVTGQLLKNGFDSKQEAHSFVAQFVARDGAQERWLDMREKSPAISPEEIDEYKNEQAIETDADSADLEITAQDIEGVTGTTGFSIYDDIKAKLIAGDIPASQIEFIHDHDTPQAKDALFKRVNAGDVRFLFGSTPKMGAGTNVQKRLVALHHIDAPWRPSDLEQREGRIIRRGNMFYERDPEGFMIKINRYATSQTYDTRRWQLLEHKAAGLEQLRHYDGANEIEDVANEAANSADMKAAASGNPLILKETQLATQVKKLKLLELAHRDTEYMTRSRLQSYRRFSEESGPGLISNFMAMQAQHDTAAALGVYNGKVLADKETVISALEKVAAITAQVDASAALIYRGLKFEFSGYKRGGVEMIMPDGHGRYMEKLSPSGVITRMDNWLEGIEGEIRSIEGRIANAVAQGDTIASLVGKSFEQQEDLIKAIEEHGKVQRALMKANAMSAVKPEELKEFDAAVIRQKKMLRSLGFGDAVNEIEQEAAAEAISEMSITDDPAVSVAPAIARPAPALSVGDAPAVEPGTQDNNFFYVDGLLGMKSDGSFTSEKRHWMTFTRAEATPLHEKNMKPYGATRRGVFIGTQSEKRLHNPKPVTPQLPGGDMERFIKVAADSIQGLRKVDVFRVLVESNRTEYRLSIADYIKTNRPDLVQEVDEVLEDARVEEARKGGTPLTVEEKRQNSIAGASQELAMQVENASTEDDFESAEVVSAVREWVKDRDYLATELRDALINDLNKRDDFRGKAAVLASLEGNGHAADKEATAVLVKPAIDENAAPGASLFGFAGAQIEAMQGGKLKGASDFPGVAPTQAQIAARKDAVQQASDNEAAAVTAAVIEDGRFGVLRDAGVQPTHILQAAKELREGDDSLLKDLARIANVDIGPLLSKADSKAIAEDKTIVREGIFSGQVLSIENGVVTQKVNRAGDTVRHNATLLSTTVTVGEVVNIQYRDGEGNVEAVKRRQIER